MASDQAASSNFRFQYVLRRSPIESRSWGFTLLVGKGVGACYVKEVRLGGLAAGKNGKLMDVDELKSQQLECGDILRVVNGRSDVDALLGELRDAAREVLHIAVERPSLLSWEASHENALQPPGEPPRPAAATASAREDGEPPREVASAELDAGGEFEVWEDYDPTFEGEHGYMALRRGQCVQVYASTRQAGEPKNRFPEYVYASLQEVGTQEDGWIPAQLLRSRRGPGGIP
mmetsp:Transcript_6166/g.17967  ORF Transcript_6166/g.17967 Transcript_6166/m.17967 type:complete len:232 (-) Transcript_6166:3-698(-)